MSQTIDMNIRAKGDFSSVLTEIGKVKNSLSTLKIPDNISKGLEKSFINLEKITDQYKTQMAKGFETPGDVKGLSKIFTNAKVEIDKITDYMNQLSTMDIDLKVKSDKLKEAENRLTSLRAQIAGKETDLSKTLGIDKFASNIENASSKSQKLGTAVQDALSGFKSDGNVEHFVSNIEQAQKVLLSLSTTSKQNFLKNMGMDPAEVQRVSASMETLNKAVKDTFSAGISDIQKNAEGFNELKTSADNAKVAIDNIKRAEQIDNSSTVAKTAAELQKQSEAARQLADSELEAANATMSMNRQMKDLQQSTQYFFSLRNMFNLLKRGIKDAYDTIKDLDKAMTETAVVTNYSVGDMWAKLPEYTALANQLGATTQGAYETMTLYYQQGLNTAQAFALGEETIKMARIAGQDYAKTTDMMTAALRGFNMELNETSAQRVNDVYSQLAAKTASSTSEIGSAMERTASIAHSANMEFETTAAFLAQMIETTRESAENLGTAMKTIVARFQELKENPNEIVEVDGEEVDYNRVDKALKSIGVSLVDNQDKFRDLDDVFLDIASRWDGLSQMQQRYVATMAAGSRQQSRFIAMMNNYERTQELVSYATDSAGASNEQFNKTLDSLEAKVNQLQNAWNEFLMGITNNQLVKGAVDFATDFITQINKLVDAISGKSGLVQSIASIGLAFTGLKLGGKLMNSLVGGVSGLIDPQSSFTSGLFGGRSGIRNAQSVNTIKTATSPIVNLLQVIAKQLGITASQVSSGTNAASTKSQLDAARTQIKTINKSGSFTGADLTGALSGLSAQEQAVIMASSPGLSSALERSMRAAIANMDISDSSKAFMQNWAQETYKLSKRGQGIPIDQLISAVDNPMTLAKTLKSVAPEISKELTAYSIQSRKEIARQAFINAGIDPTDTTAFKRATNKQKQQVKDYVAAYRNVGFGGQISGQFAGLEKVANGIGAVTGAATNAGYAIQGMGTALQNLGFVNAGSILQSIGSGITTVGFAASSAVTAVTSLTAAMGEGGALFSAGITSWSALLPPVLAVGGAIAALSAALIIHKKHIQEIKDTAQSAIDDYNNGIEQTTKNLSTLESYQGRFEELQRGVDSSGHNINLDSSEYDEYREIVREIAEINPSIVEGYNEQGDAIINNNEALKDTIELQKQIQEQTTKTYLSPKTYSDLYASYQEAVKEGGWDDKTRETFGHDPVEYVIEGSITQDTRQIREIINNIIEETDATKEDIDAILGMDVDTLTQDTIKQFADHYDALSTYIESKSKEVASNYYNSFTDTSRELLGEYSAKKEALQPLVDYLKTYVGQQDYNFEGILGTAFTQAVENIPLIEEDGNRALSMVDQLAHKFQYLNGHADEFNTIIKEVDKQQKKFRQGEYNDQQEYLNNVDEQINTLYAWRNDILNIYAETKDSTDLAMAEMLDNQIQQIINFSAKAKSTIADTLNTFKDNFNEISTIVEDFGKIQDYGQPTSKLKSIFDTIKKGQSQGRGTLSLWAGAEALLDEKYYKKGKRNTEEGAQKVQTKLTDIEDYFDEDNAKAVGSFIQDIEENLRASGKEVDDIEKQFGIIFDKATGDITFGHLDDKNLKNLANLLGISDELLAAMLEKARQFGNIDFTNYKELGETIKSDERTYTTTDAEGNTYTYMRASDLREEYEAQGLEFDFETVAAEMYKQGIVLLRGALGSKGRDSLQELGMREDASLETIADNLVNSFHYTPEQVAEWLKESKIQDYGDDNLENLTTKVAEAANTAFEERNQTEEDARLQAIEGIQDKLTPITEYLAQIAGADSSDQSGDSSGDNNNSSSKTETPSVKTPYDGTEGYSSRTLYDGTEAYPEVTKAAEKARKAQERAEAAAKRSEAVNKIFDKIFPDSITTSTEPSEDSSETVKAIGRTKQDVITEFTQPLKDAVKTVEDAYGKEAWSAKQFGNINLDKRQVQYNDKGEAETVLGETVNTLVKGQSIPIACSLLLQTESGTPKELSKDTVQEYFNQISQKALEMPGVLDESGNLIMNKFKSAVQDLDKQGLNMEGIGKVKELYADLGETAQETSEKMHFLGNDQELGHTFQEYLNDMREINVSGQEAFNALPNEVKSALSQTMSPDFWEQNYIAPISQATSKGGTQGLSNIDTTAYAEELTNTSETSTDTGVNNALSGDHTLTVDVNPGENPTITPEISSGEIKSSSAAISEGISKEGQKGAAATGKSLTTEIGKSVTVFGPAIQTGITNSGNSAVSAVQSTLNGLKASPKITPTLTRSVLTAHGEGGSSATLRLAWSAANGMNTGSAARGDHGMIGPKGKGGLTLTGEEGFEVAWLPSENRSMILGADGPQMTDLPKDAVVWDHKKSKKILERGGINIGSLSKGTIDAGSAAFDGGDRVNGSSSFNASKILNQVADSGKQTAKNTGSSAKSDKDKKKSAKETASNTKKIAAGEDNRKRILDAISNKLDKLSNKVSDKLEQVGTTYSDVAADIKKQVSLLTRSQKINTKVVDTYNKKLRNLDHLNKKVNIKDVGKVGNLGRFVYKDSETGAYQIDRKKLKKAYKGKKYEAVYDYLNNKINDYTSKRDEAQKNVDDAKAKLNDLTNQVKETFYDWENELTKLRNFSDKLELGDSFQSKLQAYMDMVDAKMLSGLGTVAEGAEAYRSTMQKMVSSMTTGIANATQKTAAAIEKYNKDTSLSSLKAIKQRANAEWKADKDNLKKRAAARKANEDYEAVKLAKDYISISTLPTGERTASIDWAKYEAARNGKGITDATNEAVTNYLDTVIDDLKEIDDSVGDVYGRIQSLYELRTEALQTQADSAHTLISGMEAEAQEEIDKLNTINSTISNAFSELINKIRKELDRQRKLEQNEETERNISDQMNRLAMLRADTSGGNQVEIAQLERDIANARSDYEDSLEDQMLDRLQEQADEASKQREKQIKLLSAQLDQSKKTGEFVKKAEALVDAAAVGRLTPEEMADFRKYYQLANGGEDRTKYDDKLNSGSADQAMSELAGTQDTIDTVEKEVGELDKQVKIANTLDQHSGLTFSAIQDLWNDGISVKELQGLGASWKDLVKIVKDLPTLKAAGMSAKDAKANGYTAQQMKAAKYSNKDILGAGWKGVKDAKDLAKVTENGKPVYSMKQIQKTTGINAKQAYNISKANNRGTKDLAGISGKVNIDTNKKKKGIEKKGANATVGTSGKSIASNVGSTLYVYDWSNGKQGDLLAKYAINEFNAKTFKNHPKEAKQALEYAIKHGKIGDLINKDFMNLAKTAKIIGNEYTTGDKKTVSVGGDGKLYYDSDDGVRVWNPGAGKTALYKKYDNKNKKIIDSFKKKAKAKGNINREFADVLKRYGITKYASGGLASDTGLAWLDGTNSNPELILNAADTKNFIALKNVLADLSRQGIFNDSGATGNATFDIDINVDKISSDYDVDKIAARVKKVITNEAKHRNVTVMGRSR